MNIKSTLEVLEDLIEIQERVTPSMVLWSKIEKYKQRLAVLDKNFDYYEALGDDYYGDEE